MGVHGFFKTTQIVAKHPHIVTSHVIFTKKILGENVARLGEYQTCPKNTKIEGYNTRVRTFHGTRATDATRCLLGT